MKSKNNDLLSKHSSAVQVPASHYFRRQYDHRARFLSYWQQIDAIWELMPKSVLEIGIGNSLVTNYLRERGMNILTLDVDINLRPDSVGSLLQIPFRNQTFEMMACFEVLEHLPYDLFPKALHEFHRVSKEYVIISLPDHTRAYRFDVQIPKVGEIKKLIHIPKLFPPKHVFNNQHYWEIGKAGYPLQRIVQDITRSRFNILESYRIFEYPKYHFFVLNKLCERERTR